MVHERNDAAPMDIAEFQRKIEATYYDNDSARGVQGTFVWFVEEVGELAQEILKEPRDPQRLKEEIGDVFAWLSSLASLMGVEMEDAARIYAEGCPKCLAVPCEC